MDVSAGRPRPWLTIWFHPRQAVRNAIGVVRPEVLLLPVILFGVFSVADEPKDLSYLASLAPFWRWLVILVLGVVIGLFWLFVGSLLTWWIGRGLGGGARIGEVQIAVSFGTIPLVAIQVFSFIVGRVAPDVQAEGIDLSTMSLGELVSIGLAPVMALVGFALAIWFTTISCRALSEVQGYSAWRAFATYLIVGVISLLLIAVVAVPIALFTYSTGTLTF